MFLPDRHFYASCTTLTWMSNISGILVSVARAEGSIPISRPRRLSFSNFHHFEINLHYSNVNRTPAISNVRCQSWTRKVLQLLTATTATCSLLVHCIPHCRIRYCSCWQRLPPPVHCWFTVYHTILRIGIPFLKHQKPGQLITFQCSGGGGLKQNF
jgi:hypothetical protein